MADWYATFAFLAGARSASDPAAAKLGLPDVDGLNVWSVIAGAEREVRDEVPLAVYPEGHWCDGGTDPRPSQHKVVSSGHGGGTSGTWCTTQPHLSRNGMAFSDDGSNSSRVPITAGHVRRARA